jgi:uncharacterized delta-60 repeat protein
MHPVLRSLIAKLCLVSIVCVSVLEIHSSVSAQDFDAQAAAGSLDLSFGNGGKVATDFLGNADQLSSVAIQPDGKIVVAGDARAGSVDSSDFALARYTASGALDHTFGVAGRVTTDFFGHADQAFALAIQSDGKIVVGGTASVNTNKSVFAVARYTSDGSPDVTFGGGSGRAAVDFGNVAGICRAIGTQTDGKIVLAGSAGFLHAIARCEPNGLLDNSFGAGGKLSGSSINELTSAAAMSIQSDGKIVVVGSTPPAFPGDFAMARYTSSGSLDSGFGNGGLVTTDFFGQKDSPRTVRILPGGKLLVTGVTVVAQNTQSFAMARYNANGTLDAGFGNGGKVTTGFAGGTVGGGAAALQADGRIILAGAFSPFPLDSATTDVALARYTADGELDSTFGAGGRVTTDILGFFDAAAAVAVQADDKIVVAGSTTANQDSQSTDGAVVRYLSSQSADFSIALNDDSVTGERGHKVKMIVLIHRAPGFGGAITVTIPELPDGVRVKTPQPIVATDDSVSLKLKIKESAASGSEQLVLVGTDEHGATSTVGFTLNIQ